jgi:hypothetical protein
MDRPTTYLTPFDSKMNSIKRMQPPVVIHTLVPSAAEIVSQNPPTMMWALFGLGKSQQKKSSNNPN